MILETVNSQGFFASNFSEVINNGKECFVPPYCTYSRLIEEFKEIACARLCRNTRERERESSFIENADRIARSLIIAINRLADVR